MSTDLDAVRNLAERYKADQESVYTTWFRDSEARTKAFRSIRRRSEMPRRRINGHA